MGDTDGAAGSGSDQARMWRADELGGLELLRASYTGFSFAPHAHAEFLITVTEGGVGHPIFRGEEHPVGPGDVMTLNPEEAHAGGPPTDERWAYRALYPSPQLMRAIAEELASEGGQVPAFREAVVRDQEVARRLRRAHVVAERPDSSALERESHLTETLVSLVARHAAPSRELPPLGREHAAVRAVRGYLEEHVADNVSLTELAHRTGISPFHLSRVFRRDVGLPPHAYQTQARVRRARTLLREGVPIARVAAEAGFYDQAHLTRHFKRIVGVTPGRYAAAGTG